MLNYNYSYYFNTSRYIKIYNINNTNNINNKIMENKELNIVAPEGYEIDKENSTFEKIVFKKINELPKTWEDLKYIGGAYISVSSNIGTVNSTKTDYSNKLIFPTKELAEAVLALAQLLQLRDRYNGDNKGFIFGKSNHCITIYNNKNDKSWFTYTQQVLAFRTIELRDEFYNNFKDLIEIAKPLL